MALSEDALKGLGLSDWDPKSHLSDMWEVTHHCQDAGLDPYETEGIVHWYIFFEKHGMASMEELLQKFDEGAAKKDFYEFSKYCIGLYRNVHEKQLAEETDPREKAFIEQEMIGTTRMEQLGDQYHEDPKSDYWKRRPIIVGPNRQRELPWSYRALRRDYNNLEECMADHREFDRRGGKPAQVETSRNGIAHKVHHTLNQ